METFNFSKLSNLFSRQILAGNNFFPVVLVQIVKIHQKIRATISKAVLQKVLKQNVSLITTPRNK